jgi:hypothetical protein
MPTPPWYGHLLRGITEMSRKLSTAERGGYLLSLRFPYQADACAVPNRRALKAYGFSTLRRCEFPVR